MKRVLVVVADDLGASPGTNEAIALAHRDGIVTAASLLVGLPDSNQAAKLAKEASMPLGLHLRFSAGPPLTRGVIDVALATAASSGATATFRKLPTVLARLSGGGNALARALRDEVRAQMEAFVALDLQPDHVNGHHHLHLHPALLEIVIEEGERLSFPAIRWPSQDVDPRKQPIRWAEASILRQLARRGGPRIDASAMHTSDHFRGLGMMGGRLSTESLCEALRALPPGVTELMVHPAEPDSALEAFTSSVDHRADELAVLLDPKVRRVIAEEDIHLSDFASSHTRH